MSRSSCIGAIRKELMAVHPGAKFYVPYLFDKVHDKKTLACPNCQRQCTGLIIKSAEAGRVSDVLVCSGCEHFSIYRERAA